MTPSADRSLYFSRHAECVVGANGEVNGASISGLDCVKGGAGCQDIGMLVVEHQLGFPGNRHFDGQVLNQSQDDLCDVVGGTVIGDCINGETGCFGAPTKKL